MEDAERLELEELKVRNCVPVTKGSYINMYATTMPEIEGNKLSIQYFEKKKTWWTLKEEDFDICGSEDSKNMSNIVKINTRAHLYFKQRHHNIDNFGINLVYHAYLKRHKKNSFAALSLYFFSCFMFWRLGYISKIKINWYSLNSDP